MSGVARPGGFVSPTQYAPLTAGSVPALLSPVSFDGVDLQNSYFLSGFPSPTEGLPPFLLAQWEQPSAKVAGGPSRALTPLEGEFEFDLDTWIKGGMSAAMPMRLAYLKRVFAPNRRQIEHWLVATDGLRDWQIAVRVVSQAFDQGNPGDLSWYRWRLRAAQGQWQAVDALADVQAVSGVATLAWTLRAGGNDRAPLAVAVTPSAAKAQANDYRYRRQVWIVNRAPRQLANYPYMVSLDTATEVAAGRMRADGNDLRIFVDGAEVDRWLGSMNTSLTGVWFSLDFAPARTATLRSAYLAGTPGDGGDWDLSEGGDALPDSGVLLINSEAIAYGGKQQTQAGWALTGVRRGVHGSTAASHAAGTTLYLAEHQIDLVYGWSAAPAPVRDPDTEPMFHYGLGPGTVHNGTWVYDATSGFATAAGGRPGEWAPDFQLANDKVFASRGQYATAAYPPTANGGHTAGAATGAAALWDCVNDPAASPDDDATYVSYVATGQTSFVPAAPAIPAGSIVGVVTVAVRSKSLSAGADASLNAVLKLGGVEYSAPVTPGHNAYATDAAGAVWAVNPSTAQPWTAEDVAAIQEIGVNVVGMGAATALRLTQVYLRAEYAPRSDPAASLGLYANPNAPMAGYPTADTWMLATPAGVKGAGAISATLAGDPGGTALGTVQLVGTDLDGDTRPLGATTADIAYGATGVLAITPLVPMVAVGVRLNTVSTALFDGVGLSAASVTFGDAPPFWDYGAREDLYVHRWTLANAETGQQVQVLWPGALGVTLTLDADAKTVSYGLPGYNATPALVATTDDEWLEADAGDNALTWTDGAGDGGTASVAVSWRDRLR